MKGLVGILMIGILLAWSAGCTAPAEQGSPAVPVIPSTAVPAGIPVTGGPGTYPNYALTPGGVNLSATTADICTSGYSSQMRDVSESVKEQVYTEYGIASHTTSQYEIDHFVPLELGGSNAITNLWPEAASPTPGFHEKDVVENTLHARVCSGALSLRLAQALIMKDWVTALGSSSTYSATSGPAPSTTAAVLPAVTASVVAPVPSCTVNYETGTCPTGKCWVRDYCRQSGTHVNGYCRAC